MLEPQNGNTPEIGGVIQDLTGINNPEQKNEEGKTPEQGEGQGQPASKTFTQDDVNKLLAQQKREHQEKLSKMRAAGLSDEQINVLDKQEEVQAASEELSKIRQERVTLILEKNEDLVKNLDPSYVEKLKQADPAQVEEVFSAARAMVPAEGKPAQPQGSGTLPSMEDGGTIPNSGKEQKLIEGIDSFQKTGNPDKMVSGLIDSWGLNQ